MKIANWICLAACAVAAAWLLAKGDYIGLLFPVVIAAITIYEMHIFGDDDK